MAAITKPDGRVRPLHDATHPVMVNHEIRYADQIQCLGPAEVASMVRETNETGEASFCLSADIRAGSRLVKIREALDQQGWNFRGELHPLVVSPHGLDRSLCGARYGFSLVHAGHLCGCLAWIFHRKSEVSSPLGLASCWPISWSVHLSVITSARAAYPLTSWGSIYDMIYVKCGSLRRGASGFAIGS